MSEASRPGTLPPLAVDAHKGVAGRVQLVCGSRDMPGAAVLAARAAQRAGAGLVIAARTHHSLQAILGVGAPEAVQANFEERSAWDAHAPHARLVGPGLGASATTRGLVEEALGLTDGAPLVLDADALGVFAGEPERLARGAAPRVLTPHPGEASRLLGRTVGASAPDRVESARELAGRADAVVCLKGAGTVVVAPDGDPWTCATGNPGMATAGAGDVLAGVLTAYLAGARAGGWNHTTEVLARLAVWVHGRAGDLAAGAVGERGLVASDLIDFLPAAQAELAP